MDRISRHIRRDGPPPGYTQPPFPSLFWPPQDSKVALYELDDIWKFTLYWTLILYGLFHLGAVGVAVLMQIGKRRSTWKYLWIVPLIYAFIAACEAVIAGSVVGLMSVSLLLLVRVYMLMFAGSVLAILLETSPCRPGFRLYGAGSTSWCCWSRPSEYRAVCNWHRDNGFCASWA
uniref:Integral membrane protein n=1 Tax=Podospora anserina (strain S / ATCC MYA-4624 / DSM 980 / FGSC 10383) TaxID=515849 RepID=A0A090CXG0_PODAN|nr:Putative protein of unknown function [Podospora anserina S mat+]